MIVFKMIEDNFYILSRKSIIIVRVGRLFDFRLKIKEFLTFIYYLQNVRNPEL